MSPRMSTRDRITTRRMRRAAQDCLIAIRTGRLDVALQAETTFIRLRYEANAATHGRPVTLIEAAT